MTTAVAHTGTALPGQDLHCFVCDVAVTGRYYTLATCRTQSTKVRLIEKLGQLVGERYMVVISEDDIICRGCATLINTLDRLETEMGSVRGVVLRFLEKKYALEEGELVNTKPSGAPAPPPQITPSSNAKGGSDGTTSIVMTQGEDGQLTALTGTDNNDTMTIDVSGMVMQGVDGVEGEAMCVMPITDEATGEHIEHIEGTEDGNVYVHVVDMSGEEVGQLSAGSVGNVARVNDDGTVEMVQVMWDEMNQMVTDNTDGDPDQTQEFSLE
ncbi:hypothetical protein ONE63_001482 [Megalurothrips usitatus]|uniref:ZAD domain-containing protein n=1 Tax=Megalurothrips usitatus TaxID=439358 RepID=A0AAV7XC73_9NEOP|nr:hypothetical protein ONE63_001482 [Megalurothrips usitatus]